MSKACRGLGGVLGLVLMCSWLSLCIGSLVGGIPGAQAQGATVEVGSAALSVGGQAAVDVWVRGVPRGDFGLGAYAISVSYDPATVQVGDVSGGDRPFDAPVANILEDRVRITQFSTAWPGPMGDVRIARVGFTCLKAGTSDLVPEVETLANVNGDAIPANLARGIVTQTAGATATPSPVPTSTPVTTPTPTPLSPGEGVSPPAATPTLTPTSAPTPTAVSTPAATGTPTPAPAPTATARPAVTPVVSTPTPTPTPAGVTPAATPARTPAPTPTPTAASGPGAPVNPWVVAGPIIGVLVLALAAYYTLRRTRRASN